MPECKCDMRTRLVGDGCMEPDDIRSTDLLGEPMVHYAHKQDPNGIRFRQYAKDPLPQWAVDVQPCKPNQALYGRKG